MSKTLVVFEILKTQNKVLGRIEVMDDPEVMPCHFGVYFFLGDQPAGCIPRARLHQGEDASRLVIGYAALAAQCFARQHYCNYIRRDGGFIRKTLPRARCERPLYRTSVSRTEFVIDPETNRYVLVWAGDKQYAVGGEE